MTAIELRGPAVADGDLAVLQGMAVADDEMVGQPVFHVPLDAVIIIHALDAGVGRCAVVNHDVFPFGPLDADSVQLFWQKRTRSGLIFGRLRIGNDQLLTDPEFVGPGEAVAPGQFPDGQPIFVSEVGQRVVVFDGVVFICRRE